MHIWEVEYYQYHIPTKGGQDSGAKTINIQAPTAADALTMVQTNVFSHTPTSGSYPVYSFVVRNIKWIATP
jgi:hypothetical protein